VSNARVPLGNIPKTKQTIAIPLGFSVFYSVTLSYNRLMTTEKSEERNATSFCDEDVSFLKKSV
jgi:hypothetical protein